MYNINLLMTFYFVTYNYSTDHATVDGYYLLLFQTDIIILVITY